MNHQRRVWIHWMTLMKARQQLRSKMFACQALRLHRTYFRLWFRAFWLLRNENKMQRIAVGHHKQTVVRHIPCCNLAYLQ
jgi:hypothetical protein